MTSDPCPHCGIDMDDGDIRERLKEMYPSKPEDELDDMASHFGWTPENPKRFSKRVGISDMWEDRVTHFICPACEEVLP